MTSWAPFPTTQTLSDLEIVAESRLMAAVPARELGTVTELLEVASFGAGERLALRGAPLDAALLLLEGIVASESGGRVGSPGRWFGVTAFAGRPASWSEDIVVRAPARVARFLRARFERLAAAHPALALAIARAALASGEAAARARVKDQLPEYVGGALVAGARANQRTLSLLAPAPVGVDLEPLTTRDWEGREIYRRTASLVFLEAASRLGRPELRLGPSWTTGRIVLGTRDDEDLPVLAGRLTAEIASLVASATTVHAETWPVDEAAALLRARGWDDAADLLTTSLESHVELVACGEVRAPSPGVMLPHAGMLSGVVVVPLGSTLALDFGATVRRELAKRQASTIALETRAPRYGSEMTSEERRWLALLGITSVGSFNRAVVSGEVRELIHVSEGFQEKRIALLADHVRDRRGVRVIAVAGPSSSGKTTFLERLRVQLEVDGIRPVGISLDDYYVDRAKTARDASGEYDYESFEALQAELLRAHVAALLRGEAVRTARYDFSTGTSSPEGGPELVLGPDSVLLVEGIHALSPALFPDLEPDLVFRLFIHPATALPFDALSSFEPSDVRLIRRIVRDRHKRGATAEANLARWPSVRRGERLHIFTHQADADQVFDTALLYEISVLKVFAERYLLEVPRTSAQYPAALRLRRLLSPFVAIDPDHVPPASILREFIGGAEYPW